MRDNKILFLYAAIVAVLMPLMVMRGVTPDNELRYLFISDAALADGHWFTFTLHGEPYADKPPLYFWLFMAVKSLTGCFPIWLLTLFSLIPGLAVAWLTARWAEREVGAFPHAFSTLTMMTAGYYVGAALVLRMDMLMCLFITAALLTFYSMYVAAPGQSLHRRQWLLGLLLFVAVFTKGPLGAILPLSVIVAMLVAECRWRSIGRYLGWRVWLTIASLCTLWFVAVWHEGGSEYLNNLVFHQTAGRAVNSFHHARPPYFYLYALWYSLAPWAPVLFAAIAMEARGWWHEQGRRGAALRFMLLAAVVPIVVLSAISSKLEIYALPAFPFIVALGVMGVSRRCGSPLLRSLAAIPAVVFAATLPALLALPHTPIATLLDPQWTKLCHSASVLLAATVLTTAGGAALWLLIRTRRTPRAISLQAAAMLVAAGLVGTVIGMVGQ